MPTGEVGGGHQNSWRRNGRMYQKNPKAPKQDEAIDFKKGNFDPKTSRTNRNESECWTAGTPIRWNDGTLQKNDDGSIKIRENGVRAIVKEVRGIDMLVSLGPDGEVVEYHPLITFFNEVMATILNANEYNNMLKGLDTEEEAERVWEFLKKRYGCEDKVEKAVAV
jgi:hypothetical protein